MSNRIVIRRANWTSHICEVLESYKPGTVIVVQTDAMAELVRDAAGPLRLNVPDVQVEVDADARAPEDQR